MNQNYSSYYNELPVQHANIQNLLRMNKGKKVTIYTTFTDSIERDKEFNGIIEQSGIDNVILSEPESGYWFFIPIIYINYIKFYENIEFN